MIRMVFLWSMACGLVALTNSVFADSSVVDENPADQKGQVNWEASYKEALSRAKTEKKPILVAFNHDMDGEIANKYAAETLYRDPEFVKLSRSFICVIGSTSKHTEKVSTVDGEERSICSRFGHISCREHQSCEKKARNALIGKSVNIAPQHLLLTPEGEIVERRAYHIPLDGLMAMMRRVLGVDDSGAPEEVTAELKRKVASLFEAAEKESWSFEKRPHVEAIANLHSNYAKGELLKYLSRGEDSDIRIAILGVLSSSGDYSVLDEILTATRAKNGSVALAAVDALGTLKLPDVAPDLKKLLKRFKGNDHGRVLRAYAKCARGDEGALKLVRKKAKGGKGIVRAHALAALSEFDVDSENEKILRKGLAHQQTILRAASAWSLGMAKYRESAKILDTAARREKVVELRTLMEDAIKAIDRPDSLESCDLEYRLLTFFPMDR